MPYRAMFMTMLTVALALLLVGMWVRAITPVLAQAQASTQAATMPVPVPVMVSQAATSSHPAAAGTQPDKSVRQLISRTMMLAFTLVGFMLVVGIFASMREWIRYRTLLPVAVRGKNRTKYVDVWKIAGDRAAPTPPDDMQADEPGDESG